jgi:capsular polysaccharide biosynthesis protein
MALTEIRVPAPGSGGAEGRAFVAAGAPDPESRGAILQRRWWLVLLIAIVAGGATYAVSTQVPATYKSATTVRVNLLGGGAAQQSIAAANDLASQLAQTVTADSVLVPAGRTLHESASALRPNISGGTVADQNVIQIQGSGSTPEQAQRRASAVGRVFASFVRAAGVSQSNAYNIAARRQLKPLADQIGKVTRRLAGLEPQSSAYRSLSDTLATLITQRSAAVADIAQSAVGGRASVTGLEAAGPGAKIQPKPALYGFVGFLVALLVASQLIVYFAPRRR